MRFAPPSAMRVVDRGGGLNQTSVRTYNERLVMSLLRRHGHLSRMEIGQHSGLSAQTVSVIVRSLERDVLVQAGEAQRGRVGPPSIPMSLNPEGAFAIGIKIGRRSIDAVLMDFVGGVRTQTHHNYPEPDPDTVFSLIQEDIEAIRAGMETDQRERLVGIGISLPDDVEIWSNLSSDENWTDINVEDRVARFSELPVYLQNDVTAAAGAELLFGAARELNDFAYFYIGYRSASRLVLNHHVYAGRKGRAASAAEQLASIADLEVSVVAAGLDAEPLSASPGSWPDYGEALDKWIEATASELSSSIMSMLTFVDVDRVIIDGRMPATIRNRLAETVGRKAAAAGLQKDNAPSVAPALTGPFSKALGAASLPFHSRFMVEQVGLTAD
ncbi:ROK family transcriptional regulator [Hoeflea sp. WL0058]|uniref:ROK family transcriptional regulator n=1 Tax=Flavimaribacter sediminis TaxID=2865987 RepID=A0AAE2ZS34_9HYPH|nr:ROK family transcriptional regulator [Flavimaribacter sediminis]MBW8639810.1 ROK family transcriptional regulator [Flavimaribacter sediminis]